MICYKDTTYCVSPNCRNRCGRKLTDEVLREAREWWKGFMPGDGKDMAIAMGCLCGGGEKLERHVKAAIKRARGIE